MRSKLKIIIPLLLLAVGGGVYKLVLAKPAPAPKMKVHGPVYVLPKEFLVNLTDGRFARIGIGLILEEGAETTANATTAAAPPEGYGALPQEALVRALVTDALTKASSRDLLEREARKRVKEHIAEAIRSKTDVEVEEVLMPDLAVQ